VAEQSRWWLSEAEATSKAFFHLRFPGDATVINTVFISIGAAKIIDAF
jgi:hypothetical protein